MNDLHLEHSAAQLRGMTAPDASYFQFVRREIEPLLPAKAPARILEIGAASGATLRWLKARWPDAETVGVDGFAGVEPELAANADRALIHDLDTDLPDIGRFDLVLALDVLEHLRDPQGVLNALADRLNGDGTVIVSVPNIANFGVVLPLLLKRRFRYTDAGILDRTHLRFFTEESALELMHGAGLKVTGGVISGFAGRKRRAFDKATLGRFAHYLAMQYIMRGEPSGSERFRWRRY